jgi:hypothetical protein
VNQFGLTLGPSKLERADAARNRRQLPAVAREMLAEQGADKLTMDALAERAGLGKGTVFRRFGTRPGSSSTPARERRRVQFVPPSGMPPSVPGHGRPSRDPVTA